MCVSSAHRSHSYQSVSLVPLWTVGPARDSLILRQTAALSRLPNTTKVRMAISVRYTCQFSLSPESLAPSLLCPVCDEGWSSLCRHLANSISFSVNYQGQRLSRTTKLHLEVTVQLSKAQPSTHSPFCSPSLTVLFIATRGNPLSLGHGDKTIRNMSFFQSLLKEVR